MKPERIFPPYLIIRRKRQGSQRMIMVKDSVRKNPFYVFNGKSFKRLYVKEHSRVVILHKTIEQGRNESNENNYKYNNRRDIMFEVFHYFLIVNIHFPKENFFGGALHVDFLCGIVFLQGMPYNEILPAAAYKRNRGGTAA